MSDTLRQPNTGAQAPISLETTSRSQSPASHQPRKFDQLSDEAKISGKKDNSMRLEVANPMNVSPLSRPQRSRTNSVQFTFNNPRQDSMSFLNHYPMPSSSVGPSPSTGRGSSAGNGSGSSFLPFAYQMEPGRLRNDSASLPPPLAPYRTVEQDSMGQAPEHPVPSRSTSIFSSLIQLPPSTGNSVSGPSSKEPNDRDSRAQSKEFVPEYEQLSKDSLGNIFTWDGKRNSKGYDPNAFWEQMNMPGSIAGVTNESLNAFLSSLQSNGSIDISNMSNEQRRASFMKFINDQGQTGQTRRPSNQTNLREDIFDPKMPDQASKPVSEANHMSPASSITSKASSRIHEEPQSPKASPQRLNSMAADPNLAGLPQGYGNGQYPRQGQYYMKPSDQYPYPYDASLQNQQMTPRPRVQQSPQQTSPLPAQAQNLQGQNLNPNLQPRNLQPQNLQSPQNLQPSQFQMGPQQYQRMPSQAYPPQMGTQSNAYSPLFKANQYVSPENITGNDLNVSPLQTARPSDDKQLVTAQQLARSEDGRPLLGATKVDQLMLVIQAREKGNQKAIKQGPDGSILGSPHQDHEQEGVLPPSVDLMGSIEKPKDEDDDDEPSKKKRKGKKQQCPYCLKHFNQSTHLDVHMRSHIGYKPFQCTFCFKRFTQGGNLRTHMRLHTGEKPFKCEVCNRQFSRKGNLAAHMLTHNKEKPFECKLDGCDKSFTQLGNLKSHQNKFHLPTLNRLTETFANVTGVALEQLPAEERELLDYFAKLYKNSNKGIRGRGKGKRVEQVGDVSVPGSTQTSPRQMRPDTT